MLKHISILPLLMISFFSTNAQDEIYELRTYELEFFIPAQLLHDYFENALIPALNRQGIDHVGAFEEAGGALPKKVYLLIAYDNLQSVQTVADALTADPQYQKDAQPYLTADAGAIPYKRISSNLIRSTAGFPKLVKPDADANFYELRIYDSHNEDALRRKVKMFNDSEFEIFAEVGLPTVFFGHNIAGTQMPCLSYMLAFKDEAAHAEAWTKFVAHPEWLRITKLEEYANAMNDITRVFLKPLAYSQL